MTGNVNNEIVVFRVIHSIFSWLFIYLPAFDYLLKSFVSLREQGAAVVSEYYNVEMKAIENCSKMKPDNSSTSKQNLMSVAEYESTSDLATGPCAAYDVAQFTTSVNTQNPIEEEHIYDVIPSSHSTSAVNI